MIKLYFNIGLFLTSICGCFSQIALTEKDFPDALDTVRYSTTTNPNLDYSKSGEKITWDFSDLVVANQFVREFTSIGFSPVQFTYGSLAPKPYRASYFIPENTLPLDQLNAILPVSISDARSYQKSTTDSITKLGYSIKVNGVDVAFKSDTIETKYKFPMDYQQVFSTRGYTFIDLNPAADFKVKQYRNVTSTVDGHGQLILPFGTFEVLRVKREINERDSVFIGLPIGLPIGLGIPPIQTTEYEWIGKDKNDVLLKVVVNTANGSNLIQSIEYQDIYRNLSASLNEVDDHFIIYPNMVEETLSLRSNSEITKYEISDMNGKTELIGDIDGTLGSVNVTSLKSGFYFIRVNTALGYSTSRFFKQ
jgi:hypothetical protein